MLSVKKHPNQLSLTILKSLTASAFHQTTCVLYDLHLDMTEICNKRDGSLYNIKTTSFDMFAKLIDTTITKVLSD